MPILRIPQVSDRPSFVIPKGLIRGFVRDGVLWRTDFSKKAIEEIRFGSGSVRLLTLGRSFVFPVCLQRDQRLGLTINMAPGNHQPRARKNDLIVVGTKKQTKASCSFGSFTYGFQESIPGSLPTGFLCVWCSCLLRFGYGVHLARGR